MKKNSIEVGRYRVSPMTTPHAEGGFAASVSIQSGRGSASIDRVWRFVPRFTTSRAALRYAAREGAIWARAN